VTRPADPDAGAAAAPGPSALGPSHRAWSRQRMAAEVFDIVVVGGGVTGTGAALDAATRGLSVALIEARDYAAGASSKSSKLIHGGLRYLEMLDFGLVREALRERRLLLTTLAPHLVKPVPFLWPLTHRWWERPYLGAGLLLYDTMGGRKAVPRARHFSRTGALRLAPALNPDAFVGAVQFYDAGEDDARMVAVLARTAAAYGAALATNVRMDGLLSEGGRAAGVRASDLLDGSDLVIRGRHVVLATGAWTGDRTGAGTESAGEGGSGPPGGRLRVRPSKGVHIVVPRDRIRMDTGLLTRTEKSVLFVIPWGEHWLIGDTDTEWPFDPGHPAASRADIDYLLAKVNRMLRDPLDAGDIEGVFAGLRPLVASGGGDTARLSREHTIDSSRPGLSVIAGGKFTTYRVMARDLIDAASRDLAAAGDRPDGRPSAASGPGAARTEAGGGAGAARTGAGGSRGVGAGVAGASRAGAGGPRTIPPSRTHQVPLVGAAGYAQRWDSRERLASASGLPASQVERLLGRYGSCIDDLLALIAGRPELAQPVGGPGGYLAAEVVYACTHEGAVRLDDVLARRTRIAIESRDRGLAAAPRVAALMAAELGWDGERASREVDQYARAVAADLAAQGEPDDLLASQARAKAPDPVPFYGESPPESAC
jgi:glycerol-3-phosphate dehydrogenase